ncbi:MAG: GatB/YqeY domain-containing protein [Eubacteriales bacterium]|nr:GatB/YqeY domain-containing protein [Eubacteriales bacterium]
MGLKEQLLTDYKEAMKAHDSTRKDTVNLIRAAIKQHEIDQQVTLEDADIIPIIKKQLKMRTDAIADFEKAGRQDLLDSYRTEINILKQYLPEEMSEEAVRSEVEKIAEEAGLERSMKSMGAMMKASMAKLKGQADGSVVSKVVKEYLSGK